MDKTEKINEHTPNYDVHERLKISREYLILQYKLLNELIEIIDRNGRPERLHNLGVLLFSILSNAKALINLIDNGFLTEAYIIARSYLEKCVNFCYLNVCDDSEYDNYLDWSSQKIFRAIKTRQRAYKNIDHEVQMPDALLAIMNEDKAYKKYTGKKGGEKPNWTDISIYNRIKYIECKIDSFPWSGYLAAMNMIYEDASENIHGTLYGATFHTAVFYGMNKNNEDMKRHLIGTGANLQMILGFLIGGLCKVVSTKLLIDDLMIKSEDNHKNTIIKFMNESAKTKKSDDKGFA